MKEKIGMEKLIRYLLESKGEEYKEEYYEWYRDVELEQNIDSLSELKPFIKWLVENDKIRDGGIRPRKDLVKEIVIVDYKTGDAIGWKNKYTEVEQLIMYLSIQDEPIDFLCEILK